MPSVLDLRYSGSWRNKRRQKRMIRYALKNCTFDLERLKDAPGWRGPIRVEWNDDTTFNGETYNAISMPGYPNYINFRRGAVGRKFSHLFLHELGHQVHYHYLNNSTKRSEWVAKLCAHDPKHPWSSGPYRDRLCEAFADSWKVAYSPFPPEGFTHPPVLDEMRRL